MRTETWKEKWQDLKETVRHFGHHSDEKEPKRDMTPREEEEHKHHVDKVTGSD